MMLIRVIRVCLLIALLGTPGCAPPTAESLSRERLKRIGVEFLETSTQTPFANIPAAETGRMLVFVPWNDGSGGGWTDTDFQGAVADLRTQAELDFLMLRLTKLTDDSMKDVATLTQLRHLNLSCVDVTDAGVLKLAALPNLEGLYLDGCHRVRGEALASFKDVPLRKLSLLGTATSDETTDALKGLIRLEHLDLGGCRIGDKTLKTLASLPALISLLVNTTEITDAGLLELRGAPNLQRLVICTNRQITGEGIEALCAHPQLRFLDIRSTGIPKEKAERLRKEFPKIQILWSPPFD